MRIILQKLILLLLFYSVYMLIYGQAPAINWQQNYGSVQEDFSARVQNASGGRLIVTTVEEKEDPTGVYYYYLAVRKTDRYGRMLWERFFNPMALNQLPNSYSPYDFAPQWVRVGSADDMVIDIYMAPNNGAFHDLLHLDSTGAFIDHNRFDASLTARPSDELTYSVRTNGDPNIVAGYSHDSLHLIIWHHYLDIDTVISETRFSQQFLVSVDPDIFYTYQPGDIWQCADGSILLTALLNTQLLQHCTDCGPTILYSDVVLYKFDAAGTLLFSKDLLHNSSTVIDPRLIRSEINGSYWLYWRDWQQFSSHGITHILELDHSGNVLNDLPLDWNYTKLIENSDATGFYAVGTAEDSTVFPGVRGQTDAVVASFDADGSQYWKKPFGGSDFEFSRDIITTPDGGILFYADASSADGDVASPLGMRDAWLVKLGGEVNGLYDTKADALTVYPNPSHGTIYISAQEPITRTRITDMTGQTTSDMTYTGAGNSLTLRTSAIAAGSYMLNVTTTHGEQKIYRITVL